MCGTNEMSGYRAYECKRIDRLNCAGLDSVKEFWSSNSEDFGGNLNARTYRAFGPNSVRKTCELRNRILSRVLNVYVYV